MPKAITTSKKAKNKRMQTMTNFNLLRARNSQSKQEKQILLPKVKRDFKRSSISPKASSRITLPTSRGVSPTKAELLLEQAEDL